MPSANGFEPLDAAESVCPECMGLIPARYVAREGGVFFEKECPEHGRFSTIAWRGSAESYASWLEDAGSRPAARPSGPHVGAEQGCPFDCGLCAEHLGETCSAALMVTDRCNMDCRFCFTRSAPEDAKPDPAMEELREMLRFYLETSGGAFPLELCGGEPTVRDDLADIAAMARDMGFRHIQLNSNGLRLAENAGLAARLREAGVSVVYLGFDGMCDEPWSHMGDDLLRAKERAVANCAEAGLAVVLVPTLVPGVNEHALGEVLRRAIEWMPAVKGINIQPAGYLGACHGEIDPSLRLTIPDLIALIEEQSDGLMKAADFLPPACEHPLCSFQALYVKDAKGAIKPLSRRAARTNNENAHARNRRLVAQQWAAGSPLETLTVGAMLIQDAWNYDVARARLCPMHVIGDETLYPLCTKYLTSRHGQRLYPGIA